MTIVAGRQFRSLLLAALPLTPLAMAAPAHAEDAADAPADIVVTAQRLDAARDSIQPSIGASQVRIDRKALDIQPGGADRGLNKVLLQAPGVTMDTEDGDDIHIRNEHGNIQYRLNGVVIPEAISGFGPLVDTRIAQSVEVLTGALPAQYGTRTAGVIQLRTRDGSFEPEGDIGIYGGGNGTIQPSGTFRDGFGRLNVFVSGSYLQNDLGIANPTDSRDAIHDRTKQFRGFGYLSYLIDDKSRLSLFGGSSIARFQIPNTPGQSPVFTLNGRTDFDSAKLDQNQRQETHYGVLSYQYSNGGFDLQVSPYLLWSRARYLPDPQGGELMFNGLDSNLTQTTLSFGGQADASLKLGTSHTLRFGLMAQRDRNVTTSLNRVFVVDPTLSPGDAGYQLSDTPIGIEVDNRATATTLGAYVQDEWKLAPSLTFNFGLRYDRYHWQLTEDQVSPRAGLVWKPDEATTLHAGYARNFTPPPLALIGYGQAALFEGTSGALEVSASDPVRAEREHVFDLGVQRKFGNLTLGIDSYYKRKTNLLDDTVFGSSQLTSPFNYAKSYSWGVELSAAWRHGPWSVYGNLARGDQKAKGIVSNQYFFGADELAYSAAHYIYTDHSQKWTASGGFSADLSDPLGKLEPSLDFNYGSGLRRTLDTPDAVPNGATQPAYVLVNLGLAQTIGHDTDGGWTVRVDVNNLFDKVVLIHDGSGVGAGQPQYANRRAVMFGLKKSF